MEGVRFSSPWVFVVALGLCCCVRTLPSCDVRASHCSAFSGGRAQTLRGTGFSSCGARALVAHGMQNLSRPGTETVSPALTGGFLSSVPTGKSR